MKIRRSQFVLSALCLSWILQGSAVSQTDRWQAITVLAESLKNPSSLSSQEREDKAYQLATLTRRKTRQAAPQKLITDLASLMTDNDPLVRAWTATSLGHLGSQAAAEIPALEKALEEARAADPPGGPRTGIHLDDVIEQALKKIRRPRK
jgi:uncharacterized protein YfaS (alpha-2-macroglobulin family)